MKKLTTFLSLVLTVLCVVDARASEESQLILNFQDPNNDQARRTFRVYDQEVATPGISNRNNNYPSVPLFLTNNRDEVAHIPLCVSLSARYFPNLPDIIRTQLASEGIQPSQTSIYLSAQTLPGDASSSIYFRPDVATNLGDNLQTVKGLVYSDTQNVAFTGRNPNSFTESTLSFGTNGNGHIENTGDTLRVHNLTSGGHGQSLWSYISFPNTLQAGVEGNSNIYTSTRAAIITLHCILDPDQSASLITHVLNHCPADVYPSRNVKRTRADFLELLGRMENQDAFRNRGGHLVKIRDLLREPQGFDPNQVRYQAFQNDPSITTFSVQTGGHSETIRRNGYGYSHQYQGSSSTTTSSRGTTVNLGGHNFSMSGTGLNSSQAVDFFNNARLLFGNY